jgi:peptide/nickel transport system substrate-binding protein
MQSVFQKSFVVLLVGIFLVLAGCDNNSPASDTAEATENETDPAQTSEVQTQQTSGPHHGEVLSFAVPREPPSFDCHQENTFACIHPIAPFYSLLIRFDQNDYPAIVGDLAESWQMSDDGLTYTFTLHNDIQFHDGTPLTSRDVKASYEKIIFPPDDVSSVRKGSYLMVESISATDPLTVAFHLKWPSMSFLPNMASPWNFIYSADKLEEDPNWYRANVMGSGAFEFVEYVSGSNLEGKKFDRYFMDERPYLDGFNAIFIPSMTARVSAVRGGEALIEFRGFTPSARDDIVRTLEEEAEVQEGPWLCYLNVAINNEREPFNDSRVRRALNLALDRWGASESLSKITLVKYVGGVMRPGSEYAPTEEELEALEGYGKDIDASRARARQLLADAGIEEGFSFHFKNRGLGDPFEQIGVWLIDQWRQIGLNVDHVVQEDGPFFADRSSGNFDTTMDWECGFMDEPDLQLFKFLSHEVSGSNYSRYIDPELDAMYERQSQATTQQQRRAIVREFERHLINEKAYTFPTLWYFRISPHWAKVRGWTQLPSHYLNQDLRDVWISQE